MNNKITLSICTALSITLFFIIFGRSFAAVPSNNTANSSPDTNTNALTSDISEIKLKKDDGSAAPQFKFGQEVILVGKASPHATVKLYIFSEPIVAEAKADEKGDWTYKINDLESGFHRVEAETVTPTGLKSPRILITKFIVDEPPLPPQPKFSFDRTPLQDALLTGEILSMALLPTLVLIRRRKGI